MVVKRQCVIFKCFSKGKVLFIARFSKSECAMTGQGKVPNETEEVFTPFRLYIQ